MVYWIVRFISWVSLKVIFRWRVSGRDNLPSSGPVIMCSNHFSWIDPLLLAAMTTRPLHFMAKKELFEIPVFRHLWVTMHAFPVRRGEPDRSALRRSLQLLEDGRVLAIFPEGTRGEPGKVRKGEPGTALIALKSEAPVVPVGIKGRYRLFHPMEIIVGDPLTFNEYYGQRATRSTLAEVTETIMSRIRNLVGQGGEGTGSDSS